MIPEDRRQEIVNLIQAGQKTSVEWLAERLDASRETIRRDLADLDRRGLLRKVHGGAVIVEPGVLTALQEGPLHARMTLNVPAKRAIARAAAALFRPGDSLFIDTGSTTLIFAEALASVPGLTVITNSATIAAQAAKSPESRVFQLGGEFRRGGQECVGEMTVQQVGQFRAAHAVLTVAAVAEIGFMDHDFQEAQVARAMVKQAASVTVLADGSKMGGSAVFEVGQLDIADRIVADAVPESLARLLRATGVEIIGVS